MSNDHSSENEDISLQTIKAKLNPRFKKITCKKEFCCVCLNNVFGLYKVTKKLKDRDVSFLTMLERAIPEIEWCSAYHICTPCSCSLDDSYTFWETCVENSFLTKKPLNKINEELKPKDANHDNKNDDFESKYNKRNFENDENGSKDIIQIKEEDIKIEIKEKEDAIDEIKKLNDTACANVSDIDESGTENDIVGTEKETKRKRVQKRINTTKTKITKKRRKREFGCENCNFSTTQSTQLVDHYVEEHKMKLEDVRPFKCHSCPKTFDKIWLMTAHTKCHEDDRPKVCTYCGKGFKRDADLQGHEKRHLNMREYKCELCGKGYNTYKDLNSHKVAVHTDPTKWKWVCEICSKPFPIKSNYDSHMRRHKGDKKFACYLCPKKFTDKIVLQKHMRVHSNVRNYKCSTCGKEYKEKGNMLIHMAQVHSIGVNEVKIPQKPPHKYICHICPKAFCGKAKLTRHLYTHSGEKPYGCTMCEKKFTDKSYIKQHMSKSHGNKK